MSKKLESILCVIDPTTTSQPALQRALWLSTKTGAKLNLLICYYNEFLSGNRFFDSRSLRKARADMLERQSRRLEALAEPARQSGLAIETAAVWDHPLYEGIVRHVNSSGADIVFKDTHQHAGPGLTALSNTDWSLIRTCPVPLWLVKPNELPDQPRLIAAVDPMNEHDKPAALDDEILLIGESLAQATGGELHAFHSYDTSAAMAPITTGLYVPAFIPPPDLLPRIRESHQKRFEEVLDLHNIGPERAHLAEGNTHEVLPVLAKKLNASLVIMGAVARNRLKRIFIGATAERTLERVPCDLLIVKPDWFKTPVKPEIEEAA